MQWFKLCTAGLRMRGADLHAMLTVDNCVLQHSCNLAQADVRLKVDRERCEKEIAFATSSLKLSSNER
jgi:hypothetical protein